jgi:hypothetical protein
MTGARISGVNLERAIRKAAALAAVGAWGCTPLVASTPPFDLYTYDLKKTGVTCMRGLRHDEARGCTRDVGPGEGELRVRHRDEMSPAFVPVRVLFLLDGRLAYLWNAGAEPPPARPREAPATAGAASLEHAPSEEIASPEVEDRGGKAARMEPRRDPVVLDVPVSPEYHWLQVSVVYRGHGSGVFSYLNSYRFEVRHVHGFTAAPGALSEITVVSDERGRATIPLEERPHVRFIGP